jgi:peptidoglycan L-alanyl-D-glutamate endopeptidase CwlK
MRRWGTRSLAVRETLDPRLRQVVDFVLGTIADISLTEGFRNKDKQNHAFHTDKSKVMWPNGKHNKRPSHAVDFDVWPRPAVEREHWAALGMVAGAARVYGFANGWKIRWGGDWDMDGDLSDNDFDDLFHLEIDDENSAPWTDPSRPAVAVVE